jgi:hypothetical protein
MKQMILSLFKSLVYVTVGITLFATACKKNNAGGEAAEEIEIAGKGVATGTPKTAAIGPQGGKLVSTDGFLEISVPAGAVSATTTFSVTPITNTSSAGVGLNYRIEPHLEFAKPVKLTFSYATVADSLGASAFTGISTQDETGTWQLQLKSQLDSNKKQISVETTHFSDWALTSILKIMPGYSIIGPGDEMELYPYAFISRSYLKDLRSIFSSAGANMQVPLVKGYVLPMDYISGMALVGGDTPGAGTLSYDKKPGVVFKASTDISPAINPVTIQYGLKSSIVRLQATIKIMEPINGVKVEMNGDSWQYLTAFAGKAGDEYEVQFSKTIDNVLYRGYITWKGTALGAHSWNDDNIFHWEPEEFSPRRLYRSYYNDNMDLSKGEVIIRSFGAVGEMVSGEFRVQQAGATNIESGDGEYLGHTEIKGAFIVRRSY